MLRPASPRPGPVLILGLALAVLSQLLAAAAAAPRDGPAAGQSAAGAGYAGSPSCKSCHEKFYSLWSSSRHGLAMRPYSDALGASLLVSHDEALAIGEARYQAFVGPGQGFVREYGPAGERDYPIAQVLGGKNVCYFMTLLERGRLQTLPLAFDVNDKKWFDTAASGLRHSPGAGANFAPQRFVPQWRDPLYTFNTSCYNCHVSQLATNYDPASDAYGTTWAEPGINCETCHGPSARHNAVCAAAPKGTIPEDLQIIRMGALDASRRSDACAVCHAKMAPITARFAPGERFFDHFDLIVLDSPDYHPDGRDLGENFTYTSWLSSPCAASGKLDCIFCHTSSGRFKQARDPDQACLPCHQDKLAGRDQHTRHQADSQGSRCVACHMPKTAFARMTRSDHSMLPPAPAATARFGSPNACQGCHTDKDAAWADAAVRAWRPRDYQARVLRRAELIDRARKRDFSDLGPMLDYLGAPDRDAVAAASLVRLVRACPDGRKWPALRAALADPSPLVRASAAAGLADNLDPATVAALTAACADPSRLVRVRAAEALAGARLDALPQAAKANVADAARELDASFAVRQDDWTGSYNRGNFLLRSGDPAGALEAYAQAMRLRPDAAAPPLNAAMAKARLGDLAGAEDFLRQARSRAPQSAAAAFNLGLVLAERGRKAEAASQLGDALRLDPGMAEAAYNLGMLTRQSDPAAAAGYLRRAAELRPDIPKYAKALSAAAPSLAQPPGGAGR